MANNCLVTKLRGTVNNPNLPVLEVMQQFTLDAITASGNSSMTDYQKWALNHFFYQIGAIDNNSLWAKVKYLAIPMICGDVNGKALRDYKNNAEVTFSEGTWENHGVSKAGATALSSNFSGSNNDATIIVGVMNSGFVNATNTQFVLDKNTSDRRFLYIAKSGSTGNIYIGGDSVTDLYTTNETSPFDIGAFTSASDRVNVKVMRSSDGSSQTKPATATQLANRKATITYSANYLRFNTGSSYYGLMLISSTMTDDERDKVMAAVRVLKLAFGTSS